MLKEKDVAIGLIVNDGRLLILQRKDENPMWDKKWEFPGGKVEGGEERAVAVCREVLEETGLQIENPDFLGTHTHDWQMQNGDVLRVHLHCFLCPSPSDAVQIESRTCYGHTWIDPKEVDAWDLLEANADLTKRLLWPRLERL